MDFLGKNINYPLEREYEAWIINQIEKYFKKLSIDYNVFAVSPVDEKTWPADEAIDADGKIVGLQFKRPSLAPPHSQNDYTRLFWEFGKSSKQLHLVVKHSEIFYCLPTFTNREVREEALRHCLFWRPENTTDRRAWYNNPNPQVRTKYAKIGDASRWGYFAEQFISCEIGLSLTISFSSYMEKMREELTSTLEDVKPEAIMIYFVFIKKNI